MSNPASGRGLKYAAILAALIIAPALAFFSFEKVQAPISTECDLYFSGGFILHSVPLADNPSRIRRGLSGEGRGERMFFSWQKEEIRSFWMKDTPVNLSIGFFDSDGFLIQVVDMESGSEERHTSNAPILYALELPRGQFQAEGLELRSRLIRKECRAL